MCLALSVQSLMSGIAPGLQRSDLRPGRLDVVPQPQSGTGPGLNSVFMVPKFFPFPGYHTVDPDGGKGGG